MTAQTKQASESSQSPITIEIETSAIHPLTALTLLGGTLVVVTVGPYIIAPIATAHAISAAAAAFAVAHPTLVGGAAVAGKVITTVAGTGTVIQAISNYATSDKQIEHDKVKTRENAQTLKIDALAIGRLLRGDCGDPDRPSLQLAIDQVLLRHPEQMPRVQTTYEQCFGSKHKV